MDIPLETLREAGYVRTEKSLRKQLANSGQEKHSLRAEVERLRQALASYKVEGGTSDGNRI